MIVAIERYKFTYLYKYNEIRVDINQVIDKSIENLKWMLQTDIDGLVRAFSKAIPLFEQDHEIILLEVDKSKIKFHEGIVLSFDSILCIYPITIIGSKLLDGKISDDFILELPVFEKGFESLKIIRSMEFRRNTSEKLLAHFKIETILNKDRISAIEAAVKKNLLDKNQPQVFTSFLDHLIAYNKTPSYIPDGNIEHICKIGAIAIKYLGRPDEVFTNGPFYKSSLKYKSKINNKSYLASYQDFMLITDDELKLSYDKMVEIISKDYKGIDIFKVSFFFLAFKSFINKHDNNIEGISNEIDTLIKQDRNTAAFVLSLLGYTFSMENIYEGIHRLSNAPSLKSTTRKKAAELEKAKRKAADMEQQKESASDFPEPSVEKETIKDVIVKIESGVDETIPNDPIEKTEETINAKSIETVAEPIVIYEVNEPQTQDENDLTNNSATNTQHEEQSKNNKEELVEKSSDKELLTVQIFRNYLIKGQTEPKQKIWFELLDQFFPIKYDEILLESLLDKIDTVPEVKDKLLKTKKDRKSIKAFFDSYK